MDDMNQLQGISCHQFFFFIENVKDDWKDVEPEEDYVRKTEY